MRAILMAAATALLSMPTTGWADNLSTETAALRDRALVDTTAWDLVESLTTEVGARPVGSPAMERARDWALAKLRSLGFQNVRAEAFTAESWLRGEESAEVVAPFPQKLAILGLGRSVPTPKGGVEGDVVLFHSLEELIAAAAGSLKGKIVVLNQPMGRTQDASSYGANVKARTQGAAVASQRGAIAFLVRSLSTDDTRLPHTGAMRQAEDAPSIPAAAISVPDAQLLERMAARGRSVRIRLKLASTSRIDAPAWNVVGEFPGREKPDEIVLIGGHLDSWDAGTGAIDDGAGVAITMAAARLVGATGPRRTIRVVLWGAEELDDSGEAYAAAHHDEVAKMALVGESDAGAGPIWRARLPKASASHPAIKAFVSAVTPLKVVVAPEASTYGGTDVAPLVARGAPVVLLSPDASRYFDLHHSADDTLDKVDPRDLAQSVATWTSLLNAVADSDVDFRTLARQP